MKTLFQMGMPGTFNFWAQQPMPMPMRRPFLGQAVPTGDLDEATKNDVYARLKDAVTKGMEIDNWIHTIGEDGQRAAFGSSFDTWRGYINSAADQAETVYPIYQRLGSTNQEDWWIQDADAPQDHVLHRHGEQRLADVPEGEGCACCSAGHRQQGSDAGRRSGCAVIPASHGDSGRKRSRNEGDHSSAGSSDERSSDRRRPGRGPGRRAICPDVE